MLVYIRLALMATLLPSSMGCVFCDPKEPIRICTRFRARILLFNIEVPITQGFPVSGAKEGPKSRKSLNQGGTVISPRTAVYVLTFYLNYMMMQLFNKVKIFDKMI